MPYFDLFCGGVKCLMNEWEVIVKCLMKVVVRPSRLAYYWNDRLWGVQTKLN